jgi:transcriptional regulator with XRE-family HTH domain
MQSLSMKDLAEKAHTTPAIISRIENAQVSAGIDLIMRIYCALGKEKIELSCVLSLG